MGAKVKFPTGDFIFCLSGLLFGIYLLLIQFPNDLRESQVSSHPSGVIVPGWELGSVIVHAGVQLFFLPALIVGVVCFVLSIWGIFKCIVSYIRGKNYKEKESNE